jgi:hypothetical protein
VWQWVQPVSELTSRPVSWLWPGWLALETLTILDGDPGMGKSLLSMELCARLSTGRPLPDGSPAPGPVGAILLNGEDGREHTIRPRLEHLGADLDRILVPRHGPGGPSELLRLPSHTDVLDPILKETGARLVVIDPITAFLDRGVNVWSDHSMRSALEPLQQLLEKHRGAALMHRHLNKRVGQRALYRGGGAVAIVGTCRCAWLLAEDSHEPGRRALVQQKNNLTGPRPGLTFGVSAPAGGAPTLTWSGPTSLTADDLLGARHGGRRAAARERASLFLTTLLKDGPRTSHEVWLASRPERLSARTLARAKRDLEIRSVRVWAGGKRLSYWLLRGQELPSSLTPDELTPDVTASLDALREQWAHRTPLDDE